MGQCSSLCVKFMAMFKGVQHWPTQREKLVKTLMHLGEQEQALTKQDNELYHLLNGLKIEANALAKHVALRPHKKPTANEEAMMQSLMRRIKLLEQEKHMKANSLGLFNKHVSSISTLIVQKDTVHQMSASVQTIHDIGIDIDGMEETIEEAANTSDQLDQMSSTMADRLADAVLTGSDFNSNYVFGVGVPFMEVSTYGEASAYNPEWDDVAHRIDNTAQLKERPGHAMAESSLPAMSMA